MKNPSLSAAEIRRLEARYCALAAELGSFDGLSQGSVLPQPPRAWKWTRKVQGKTVTVALSPEKAQKMKRAIANYRAMELLIEEMREITQNLILHSPEMPSNISTQIGLNLAPFYTDPHSRLPKAAPKG